MRFAAPYPTAPLTLIAALAALAGLPDAIAAQGQVIPGPCVGGERCIVPPCRMDMPCPGAPPRIERASSRVRAELSGRVVSYQVDETFVNHGGRAGEADYIFPLPPHAAFQDLRLSINGELVAGETLSAVEARRAYEEIVRRQRDPALVEWMGHGLLRTRIFPIAPGEEKRIVVTFQALAEREGDALRIDYARGHQSAPGVRDVAPASGDEPRSGGGFILVYEPHPELGEPYSPTHALHTRADGRRRIIDVEGDAPDVTVLLPVRQSGRPAISVVAHAPGNDDGFLLLAVTPPPASGVPTPRDVTFVLDVSGSMSGRKLEQARVAGKGVLATLRREDRFRLIDFATDVRTFRDDFLAATPEHLAEAERYLDSLQAGGSTNIAGALDEALRGRRDDTSRLGVVLFVTDGEPTIGERSPERLVRRVAERLGDRRLFTFGLGADVNAPLLEQLALEGRGTAQLVRPEEDVERAVALVASRLTDPVATGLRITADGVRLSRMMPAGELDLFAGQDLVVLARYAGSGRTRLRIQGSARGKPIVWSEEVDFPERERGNAFVPRLWAARRIGWLSAERRRSGASPEMDEEIRTLGERYGIPTEFTSYFVREPAVLAGNVSGSVVGQLLAPRGVVGAPAAAEAKVQSFEQARLAQSQRSALSLDQVVASPIAAAGRGAQGATVGTRRFVRRAGVWIDAGYRDSLRTVRVRAYSSAYFTLMDRLPELRSVFALGDQVVVAGQRVAVAVAPHGTDRLGERELATLLAAW